MLQNVRVIACAVCELLRENRQRVKLTPIQIRVNYYPFMITLNKCTCSCNALSPVICVSKEIKDIHVKACNMIIN